MVMTMINCCFDDNKKKCERKTILVEYYYYHTNYYTILLHNNEVIGSINHIMQIYTLNAEKKTTVYFRSLLLKVGILKILKIKIKIFNKYLSIYFLMNILIPQS